MPFLAKIFLQLEFHEVNTEEGKKNYQVLLQFITSQ